MKKAILLAALCLLFTFLLRAQSPGLIVRPNPILGSTPLNPDGNGYSSAYTTGFTTDDIAQSELPFKIVPAALVETTGDIQTGPSGGFTDIVTRVDGSGFYIYKDATNIYFRLRIGSITSGSKAYTVLIDTDNKMGGSGPYADPNYKAPSAGSPGNPGFEYEVSFQTNSRVAVYNVDGLASPPPPTTYALASNAQISVALSTDGNNPDYFYDWYVPLSAIGNPSSIRVVATTMTSPNSAFQGTRSDIFGINDANFANTSNAWQTVINAQAPINLSTFSTPSPTCTAPPTLNGPIIPGSDVLVGGTWSRMDISKPATATIKLYRTSNPSTPVITTKITNPVTSWNLTVPTVIAGETYYATAVASDESECLQSNSVTASSCTTPPAAPVVTCASTKGFSGTLPLGATVNIYQTTTLDLSPTVLNTGLVYVNNASSTTFNYYGRDLSQVQAGSSPCQGNSGVVATGTTLMFVTNNGGCLSSPVMGCITGNNSSSTLTALTANTLTVTTPLYPYQITVDGTGSVTAGQMLRLYVNGSYVTGYTASANASTFSFSGVSLNIGDVLQVYVQTSGSCATVSPSATVSCFSQSPIINTNTSGDLIAGATAISGTSAYPGASLQLYKGTAPGGAAVGPTITVGPSGSWSVTTAALVSGDSYYATQTVNGCTSPASSQVSVLGATACPSATFAATYSDADASVKVNMTSFTGTLYLYEDGNLIGTSATLSAASTYTFNSLSSPLYYGGVLTVTAKASNSTESNACVTQTVGCAPAAKPSVTPTTATINAGQNVPFTVSSVTANTWYALMDNTSGTSYATSVYKTLASDFSLTSNNFSTPGTYTVKLTADKLTGCPASFATATITVNAIPLPVNFLSFTATQTAGNTQLVWNVTNETNVAFYAVEKSGDCIHYNVIGQVASTNTGSAKQYNFTDAQPLPANSCYRIRQVDADGNSRYSNVLRWQANQKLSVLLSPNPATSVVTVSIVSSQNGTAKTSILDVSGRTLRYQNNTVFKGITTLALDGLQALARGNYFVKVDMPDGISYQRLLLQ